MKIRSKSYMKVLALFVAVSFMTACSSGGGGGDSPVDPTVCDNIVGTYSVVETVGSNTCGEPVGSTWDSYTVSITQDGCRLSVENLTDGGTSSGTINVSTVTIDAPPSYPYAGGTVTNGTITMTSYESYATGGYNASWTGPSPSCTASISITSTKQ